MTEIIVAVIAGAFSVVAVIITARINSRQMIHKMETAQAVTDTKIEELTREVREHNNFARRMPVVEEQIKAIHHRLDGMERTD